MVKLRKARRQNPGSVVPWKTVHVGNKDYPFFVWLGGIPTPEEVSYKAPPFTIFPSPNEVPEDEAGIREPLPHGEEVEGNGEMVWFATERDEASYDDRVRTVLETAGLVKKGEWLLDIINTNDDLRDESFLFHGKKIAGGPDSDAWPWAIAVGYSLIKVPDKVDSQYFELYILDDLVAIGNQYDWFQTKKRKEWLALRPGAASTSADLELINRHRRKLGAPPLDPIASGWKPEDVVAEANRIRALNPVDVIKERMLAW